MGDKRDEPAQGSQGPQSPPGPRGPEGGRDPGEGQAWLESRGGGFQRWWRGVTRAWALVARSRRKAVTGFFRFYRARMGELGETVREVAKGLDRRRKVRLAVAGAVIASIAGLALAVESPLGPLEKWQAAFRAGKPAGETSTGSTGSSVPAGSEQAGAAQGSGTGGIAVTAGPVGQAPGKAGSEEATTAVNRLEHLVRPVAQMTWPLQGQVSRYYGWDRHPTYGDWRFSAEMRLQPLPQEETVRAVLPGVVKEVRAGEWGSTVVLSHGDGWESSYANLASVSVTVGQRVEEGQEIGRLDTAGHAVATSTGSGDAGEPAAALVFALAHNGKPVDPMTYLIEE